MTVCPSDEQGRHHCLKVRRDTPGPSLGPPPNVDPPHGDLGPSAEGTPPPPTLDLRILLVTESAEFSGYCALLLADGACHLAG